MQKPTSRQVVESIARRVCGVLGRDVAARECVSVALACNAVRDREETLGFLFNRRDSAELIEHADALSLREDEWETLFGQEAVVLRTDGFDSVLKNKAFETSHAALQDALRCTLVERACAEAWRKQLCKVAAVFALHTGSGEERVTACLGGFVRGDLRRLDDLICDVDENGADVMLLCESVQALAAAVAN